MSERGVPVFIAPGANANAVKELVITGMLLASRNVVPALRFTAGLKGDDATMHKLVEDGKKDYAGTELQGARWVSSDWARSVVWWRMPPSASA